MKTNDFDLKFDEGQEDIIDHLDVSRATRPNLNPQRINVDFPVAIVEGIDEFATLMGITRQSLIKVWIAERLQVERNRIS